MDAAVEIAREDEFNFRSAEYQALFRASAATAFQNPLWLEAFYGRLAPQRDARKVVVTARDTVTGALLLVLPMILRRKSGILLLEACDLGVSDYAAPVNSPGFQPDTRHAESIRSALPPHDLMRVRPIRAEHLATWQACLGGEATRLDFSAHAVSLEPNFQRWREARLDPSFRRRLDRKKKRFLKQPGASIRLLTDAAEIRTAISAIAKLRAGRFDGDLIQNAYVEEFYAKMAEAGPESGFARTYAISLGEEAIGYAFGLTHAGRFNYLLIGCDYDAHGRHSPGLLLYDAMIEDWIASGGTVYDFTIGDEPFKMEFGTQPTAIYQLSRQQTWRGRMAAAGFFARERWRRLREGQQTSQAEGANKPEGEREDGKAT